MYKKNICLVTGVLLSAIMLIPLFCGCSSQKGEGFAIYLTRNNIPPDKMEMQSHVELAEEPVLTADDIISYDAQTHEIKLKTSGREKLNRIEVPVQGTSFMVCINKAPIYWGAFWTDFSSHIFFGVTIMLTPPSPGTSLNSIELTLGYPTSAYFNGKDSRNSVEIMKSLDGWSKLVNTLPTALSDELPHSMKGYELYSWMDNNEWHFRLITGTNRNKTWEEIVKGKDSLENMVTVHAEGIAGITSVLSKLPENEEVFWVDGGMLDTNDVPLIEIPGYDIVTEIENYADISGINLRVHLLR